MGKDVLLIDDNANIRGLLKMMLKPLNFSIREAENGLLGLESVRVHPPDVIFLDLDMPVMGGMEFLKAYKDTGTAEAIVIVCSTLNSMDKIVEALHLGADEYIMKPFDESILVSKLQSLLFAKQ